MMYSISQRKTGGSADKVHCNYHSNIFLYLLLTLHTVHWAQDFVLCHKKQWLVKMNHFKC